MDLVPLFNIIIFFLADSVEFFTDNDKFKIMSEPESVTPNISELSSEI